jgi:hypothetical protein
VQGGCVWACGWAKTPTDRVTGQGNNGNEERITLATVFKEGKR